MRLAACKTLAKQQLEAGSSRGGDARLVTLVFGPLEITQESVRCEGAAVGAPQARNLREANRERCRARRGGTKQ